MAIHSGFSHERMVIFHSYVELPEGNGVNIGHNVRRMDLEHGEQAHCSPAARWKTSFQPRMATVRVALKRLRIT